jgi:hypothetical protein
MVDQDILFRSGLMVAVLFLAGLFGTSIASRMKEDDSRSLIELSRDLAGIISSFHGSEPGSYLMIDFGEGRGTDTSPISFPSELGEDTYSIEILPGMVILECENKKEIVAENDFIVPCFPPDDRLVFNKTLSRRSGILSGGYKIKTPCSLILKIPEGASSGEVFISPSFNDDNGIPKEYDDLIDLIIGPIPLVPGFLKMVNISTDRILNLETSLILFHTSFDQKLSGSCSIPAFIPSDIDLEGIGSSEIDRLTIYKTAFFGVNDHIEIKWGVTNDPDHILP